MDLGGKTAWNMPGCSLFVTGRERTASGRSQGRMPPTIMTLPALRLSRTVGPNVYGCRGRRRRTTDFCGRQASDCHVPPNCSPMPRVAHTPRRFCLCALVNWRTPDMPPNDASAQPAKNAKIVETNSTSLLESAKLEKNELKTNSKRTAKEAGTSTARPRIRPNDANSRSVLLPQPLPGSLYQIGTSVKDVKIVETNSASPLESAEGEKTNSKRTQNELQKRRKYVQLRLKTC